MDWPKEATETIPGRHFTPLFCPWPSCEAHRPSDIGQLRFSRYGSYLRRLDARRVSRFLCSHCGRTFSLQTFAFSYYLKRPDLTVPIARGLVAGSAHRQIARSTGCHHSTVTRRSQRLGRHAYLVHALALRDVCGGVNETILVDDFDSFAGSQYFPCTLPTAVGAASWFVYGFAFARERRRGSMSPTQKVRRQRLEQRHGRPARGAVRDAFLSLIGSLPAPVNQPLRLVADDDPTIRGAVALLRQHRPVAFSVFANPPRRSRGAPRSAAARVRDHALFANDQLHRFLRHSQAAHRRQTIAFGRSYNGLAERLGLFIVWRNFLQFRSERHPRDGTTAMRLQLTDRPWSWERLLARRLQPSRVAPPAEVLSHYRRDLATPHLPHDRPHALINAF